MAEIEFSALSRSCLKRRNPDADALQRQITAYQSERNAAGVTIDWRFSTHNARTKLHRFYPCLSNIDRVPEVIPQTALARLRAASTDRRPVAVAAYTSRPRTTEVAGAVRLMLCGQDDDDCNRLCSARRSELAPCDRAAGFDDRELFELVLAPGHRSPLYRSIRLAARFALGLATGQEWSHFYYLNGGAEIARVEVPDWLASDPEPLALSHAMLVKQCQLGLGLSRGRLRGPRAGHHLRPRSCRVPPHDPQLLEQHGRPAPESARATSKRRPWVRTHLPVRPVTRTVAGFRTRRSVGPAAVMPAGTAPECQEDR